MSAPFGSYIMARRRVESRLLHHLLGDDAPEVLRHRFEEDLANDTPEQAERDQAILFEWLSNDEAAAKGAEAVLKALTPALRQSPRQTVWFVDAS